MRVLIVVLLVTLAWLQVRLWISDEGLREVSALRDEIAQQSAQNAEWADRNASLEAEVRDLKQGVAAAEERARSELGMVREDETFYQIMSLRDDD